MMHILFLMLWFKDMGDLEITLPSENGQTVINLYHFSFQEPRCTLSSGIGA